MLYKSASNILDVSTESRTVKAVWATLDSPDSIDDIIVKGAFDKTIAESGAKGKNRIWSLVEHDWRLDKALGKPKEIYLSGNDLIAVTEIVDTKFASDILAMYAAGVITEHSAGMLVPRDKMEMKDGYRYIKEVILKEGSATLWGVNPDTPTLSVAKGEIGHKEKTIDQRIDMLCKALRVGSISDEMAELIEIELKSIQSTLPQKSTEPQKPDFSQFGEILKNFKLN